MWRSSKRPSPNGWLAYIGRQSRAEDGGRFSARKHVGNGLSAPEHPQSVAVHVLPFERLLHANPRLQRRALSQIFFDSPQIAPHAPIEQRCPDRINGPGHHRNDIRQQAARRYTGTSRILQRATRAIGRNQIETDELSAPDPHRPAQSQKHLAIGLRVVKGENDGVLLDRHCDAQSPDGSPPLLSRYRSKQQKSYAECAHTFADTEGSAAVPIRTLLQSALRNRTTAKMSRP